MKHLLSLSDWSGDEVVSVLDLADCVKAHPEKWRDAADRKTLLMIFEKPSLRTRVSFETGCTQLGGHAIHYDTSTSPFGAGKESIADMIRVVSRYVDIVMARLFDHAHIEEMAAHSAVPVINALTNYSHPCQILADLQTVRERKGALKGVTLAYLGDSNNNVTHSLMFGCAAVGMNVRIGCPDAASYRPDPEVLEKSARTARGNDAVIEVTHDAGTAVTGADVVYTDSWMSYHIPKEEQDARVADLEPYRVTAERMAQAAPDAIFMNCLPALRGFEQTAEVIDGPQSVVFDEAENRLHAQKAVMLRLMGIA